jgi:hypothetical protein
MLGPETKKSTNIFGCFFTGKEALARFSDNEAIVHFKYVLDSIGETAECADERLVALEVLGNAYYANSMFTKAEHLALLNLEK